MVCEPASFELFYFVFSIFSAQTYFLIFFLVIHHSFPKGVWHITRLKNPAFIQHFEPVPVFDRYQSQLLATVSRDDDWFPTRLVCKGTKIALKLCR